MESHISHYIASTFHLDLKDFLVKKVEYLKLNNYLNNGINIFLLYEVSYNKDKPIPSI